MEMFKYVRSFVYYYIASFTYRHNKINFKEQI